MGPDAVHIRETIGPLIAAKPAAHRHPHLLVGAFPRENLRTVARALKRCVADVPRWDVSLGVHGVSSSVADSSSCSSSNCSCQARRAASSSASVSSGSRRLGWRFGSLCGSYYVGNRRTAPTAVVACGWLRGWF